MHPSISRRLAILVATAVLTLGIPLGVVIAVAGFNDVPTSNPFYSDITALANSGVTSGCGGGNFCPKDYVTREQMAAFMNRLGALQAGKTPVVNADKLDSIDSSGFLKVGTIVTSVLGTASLEHFDPPTTVTRTASYVHVSGDGSMVLPLPAAAAVSGVTYRLASLQVCIGEVAGGGYITYLAIERSASNGSVATAFEDLTDRTSVGCFSITPNVGVGQGLGIYIDTQGGAGAAIALGAVQATWSATGS